MSLVVFAGTGRYSLNRQTTGRSCEERSRRDHPGVEGESMSSCLMLTVFTLFAAIVLFMLALRFAGYVKYAIGVLDDARVTIDLLC